MIELESIVPAEKLIGWARALVSKPSPQTERFEAEPAVQSFIADCVRPILEGEGLATRTDAMGNLLVEAGPPQAQRSSMLLTYCMTHPAAGMENPFVGELVDGGNAIRGRGIAEQKGALAAAMAAYVAAAKAKPSARVILAVSTAGETGQHKAAESILAALDRTPQATILAIGTGGRVSVANKGRLDIHIDVAGRPSHSSTPWLGIDAIAGARAVMDRLSALDLGRQEHPLLGHPTLTATSIRSFPEATHTIQSLVRLTYDRRLLPGQDPETAFQAVQKALQEVSPWTATARAGALQYPAEIEENGALLPTLRAGCRRVGLPEPETFVSHGCVDAGLFVRSGCEAAMWGPGEQAMWHTDEERLPIVALRAAAAGYFGFLIES